jgi:protein-S-isoprenylcysteine O-methyltransferase Ste14
MANDLQTSPEHGSLTSLLTGIVNDAQELFKQQLALFKTEVQEDMRKTREAATSLALGAVVALIGVILLCFMLVHLLHAVTDPQWPLWACYGTVGGAVVVIGAVLLGLAYARFKSFNPLPDKTAAALQENLEWKTRQT